MTFHLHFFGEFSKLSLVQHILHRVFASTELTKRLISLQFRHLNDPVTSSRANSPFFFIIHQQYTLTANIPQARESRIKRKGVDDINFGWFLVVQQYYQIMEEAKQIINNLTVFSFNDYCGSGSVEYSLAFSLALGTICFILTKVTSEMSWVDRIWPILPILYQGHFIYHQQHCRHIEISNRQWLIIFFTSLWGLRLTYNFSRKGGFKKGGEDYRWAYIRQRFHWILVEILNLVFTAYYQIILILWFSSPIREAYSGELNTYDYVLAALWLTLFAGEVTADQQQWNFQTEKYRLLQANGNKLEKLPERFRTGFVTDGLFAFSRHPNFFCEISIWYVQYLFSHNSSGWNWTGLGAILLNLLFLGSTGLTEKISSQKYPLYAQYQATTSMLIPLPSRKPLKRQ